MPTLRFITYVMPWEIDDFDRVLTLLKQSSYYLPLGYDIKLDCCLNISPNYFNWDECKIPRKFFIDKYESLKTKCDWFNETNFYECNGEQLFGCLDLRRYCSNKYDGSEFHIWLDTDMFFHPTYLRILYDAIQIIHQKDEYFIITPQIIKYWDSSWDVITHDNYKDKPFNFRDEFDVYSLTEKTFGQPILTPIEEFKFAGGWFTCISNKLLKLIILPESFQSYGPDDTFIMYNCTYLKSKGFNVTQYMIKNFIVSENSNMYTLNKNNYNSYLSINHNKDELRGNIEQHFSIELKNNVLRFESLFK